MVTAVRGVQLDAVDAGRLCNKAIMIQSKRTYIARLLIYSIAPPEITLRKTQHPPRRCAYINYKCVK